MDNNFWIPRTLDAPPLFLMFESDAASLFIVTFLVLVTFNIVLATAVALMLYNAFMKMKENGGKGLITQIMYWYSPSDIWVSKYWPSSVREYSGR